MKPCQLNIAGPLVICALIASTAPAGENSLTATERSAGWLLLFDGNTTNGWMTRTSQPLPGRHVQHGSLNPHPCDYILLHENIGGDF